jgi:toxin ParE2
MIQSYIHKLAEKELLDARDYYDELVPGLGKKFILEVEFVFNRIRSNPLEFPFFPNDFRKALLRKFPYSIIFNFDGVRINILSIAHQKRKPKYYSNRLN